MLEFITGWWLVLLAQVQLQQTLETPVLNSKWALDKEGGEVGAGVPVPEVFCPTTGLDAPEQNEMGYVGKITATAIIFL